MRSDSTSAQKPHMTEQELAVPPPGRRFSRRTLMRGALIGGAAGATAAAGAGFLLSPRIMTALAASTHEDAPTVVVQWNNAVLQAIRDLRPGPPMAARALAIVHTCMYDAWTAFDSVALPTQANGVPKCTPLSVARLPSSARRSALLPIARCSISSQRIRRCLLT